MMDMEMNAELERVTWLQTLKELLYFVQELNCNALLFWLFVCLFILAEATMISIWIP